MELKNPNAPATPKQRWALFCTTKQDFRNKNLTMQEAFDILQEFNAKKDTKKEGAAMSYKSELTKITRNLESERFEAMYEAANAAGEAAGKVWMEAAVARGPVWAIVDEMAPGRPVIDTMLDVCGFAYVKFSDKRSSFYRWAKKRFVDRSMYSMPVETSWNRRQEMGLAEAVSGAAAKVYQQNGIQVYMQSRID